MDYQRIFRGAILLFALGVATLSAHGAEAPAAPAPPPANAAAGPVPPAPAAGIDGGYLIGPGDSLSVFVWRNPELSVQVPVRPDGMISTPLVEDMVAVGKTPSVLARDIEKALSSYIRSPAVNVIVTAAMSAASQVKVVGQAAKPQALPFRQGLKVMDVLISVGGMTQFAAGNRAKIVRDIGDGKTRDIRVRLHDLLEKGDMRQNLPLQAGDVVVIPESRF